MHYKKCVIFRVFEAKLGLGDFRANLRATFVVIIHNDADMSDSPRKFSVRRCNWSSLKSKQISKKVHI